jgi:hypothetical protein
MVQIMKWGINISIIGIAIMFGAMLLKLPVLLSLFIPMLIINLGGVMLLANASSASMTFATDKSHGSAVINFIGVGFATIAVFATGKMSVTFLTLPLVFSVIMAITLLMYLVFKKP